MTKTEFINRHYLTKKREVPVIVKVHYIEEAIVDKYARREK